MSKTRPRGRYILDLIPKGFLSRRQVAERLGVDYHTVYMWGRQGKLTPTIEIEVGKLKMPCYDEAKVEELAIALGLKEDNDAGSLL